MGQARKTPKKKKETKEDVLKKEIAAAVNRRTAAKINEVKTLVESVEDQVKNHLKYHDEDSEHTHSHLESRIDELERRLLSMIDELRHDVNKLRGGRDEPGEESQRPPSNF